MADTKAAEVIHFKLLSPTTNVSIYDELLLNLLTKLKFPEERKKTRLAVMYTEIPKNSFDLI